MKINLYFSLMYLVVSMLYMTSVHAEPKHPISLSVPQTAISNAQKIYRYENDKIEIELRMKHAELAMQRLLAISNPAEQFDAQNAVIGIKYELKSLSAELKNINATIAILKNVGQASTALQDSKEDEKRKRQQRALIEQSYRLKPSEAALNLAMAKALEPMNDSPVLGDAPALRSFFPHTSVTRNNGIMKHIGGNQYKLEAYLRPGKQEFFVGDMRLIKIVPVDYDAIPCLILLDASDIKNPKLEYFTQ